MQRNSNFRLLPLIISIIVIALVIAAVVSIGRAIFGGGSSSSKDTSQVDEGRDALLNTSGGHSVQMTVRGPIVANENFQSYQVDVSNSERSITAYDGYLESRSGGTTLSNNTPAYEQFVYALDKANMMKGKEADGNDSDDLRGICASGYVYEFAVLSSGNTVKSLWTSTCGGSKGTLEASKDQLSKLFLDQIPDSSNYIPFKQSINYSL